MIITSDDGLCSDQPLSDWVRAGGIMIVYGNPPGMAPELFPVALGGLIKLPASAISGGGPTESVDAVKCSPKPGSRVLAAYGDIPLAVGRRVGLGKVVYLAFDPTTRILKDNPNYTQFWRRILRASVTGEKILAQTGVHNSYYDWNSLEYALAENEKLEVPGVGIVSVFLGLYVLLLVPVNYLVLKRLRKREWAWLTVPVLVIIFSITAYCIGSAGREKQPEYKYAGITELAAGSDVANWTGRVSINSPARTQYQVEFSDPSVLVSERMFQGSESAFPKLQVIRSEDRVLIPKLDLYMWSTRMLVLDGVRRLGGTVSADLTTDGERVTGVIHSSLPFALTDCVLVGDRFKQEIGELKPGSVIKVDGRFRDQERLKLPNLRYSPQKHYTINEKLAANLHRNSMPAFTESGQLMLIGWSDKVLWNMQIAGCNVSPEEGSAVYIHIYPRWQASGRISGKIGGRISDLSSSESNLFAYHGKYNKNEGPKQLLDVQSLKMEDGTAIVEFELPFDLRSHRYTRLNLNCDVSLEAPDRRPVINRKVGVYVIYRTGKRRHIGDMKTGESASLIIPNPESAVGTDGIVRIMLSMSDGLRYDTMIKELRLTFEGRAK